MNSSERELKGGIQGFNRTYGTTAKRSEGCYAKDNNHYSKTKTREMSLT